MDRVYEAERFWLTPMVKLNPSFMPRGNFSMFVAEGLLRPKYEHVFCLGKTEDGAPATLLTLHQYQDDAIGIVNRWESYVLTMGNGSGKSLAYFIPIMDDLLRFPAASHAYFYGLTRGELRNIIDPADIYSADFLSETFYVIKTNSLSCTANTEPPD